MAPKEAVIEPQVFGRKKKHSMVSKAAQALSSKLSSSSSDSLTAGNGVKGMVNRHRTGESRKENKVSNCCTAPAKGTASTVGALSVKNPNQQPVVLSKKQNLAQSSSSDGSAETRHDSSERVQVQPLQAARNARGLHRRETRESEDEEMNFLDQIEYIWSGVTISGSHASNLDAQDGHFMWQSRHSSTEDDEDDFGVYSVIKMKKEKKEKAFAPQVQLKKQRSTKLRSVQFAAPLVTDVRDSYRVPDRDKHKFFYTANNIRWFREEYELDSQPPCCSSSLSDFFGEQYEKLCGASAAAATAATHTVSSPVNATQINNEAC